MIIVAIDTNMIVAWAKTFRKKAVPNISSLLFGWRTMLRITMLSSPRLATVLNIAVKAIA